MTQDLQFTLSTNKLIIGQTNTLVVTASVTGGPMAVTGGVPTSGLALDGSGPSTIYLSFGSLLGAADVRGIAIASPTGWSGAYFDDSEPTYWALCPTVDGTVDGDITFTLTNVLDSLTAGQGALVVDYYNLPAPPPPPPLLPPMGEQALQLHSQNPPTDVPDLHDQVELGLVPPDSGIVYTSPDGSIANTLTIGLSNQSDSDPLVDSWTDPPVFDIAFPVSGKPGYGAITTPDLAKLIQIS